jgi:hypothetical protein
MVSPSQEVESQEVDSEGTVSAVGVPICVRTASLKYVRSVTSRSSIPLELL